jgi:hypothetical protein
MDSFLLATLYSLLSTHAFSTGPHPLGRERHVIEPRRRLPRVHHAAGRRLDAHGQLRGLRYGWQLVNFHPSEPQVRATFVKCLFAR